jgi:capsular polysaccharide transport system permease protein
MNVEHRVTSAINANKNLLYFREVTTLNIMSAIWLLEFFTALTVMLVILLGLYLFGQHIIINDKLEVLGALFGISLLAAVIGGLFGVISLRWHSAVFFARSLNRLMFFLSGAFFYAGELPEQTRNYILLNPLFHYIEHLREGFFPSYQAIYVSWSYPLAFIIPGMFLLLVADRLLRGHAFEQ